MKKIVYLLTLLTVSLTWVGCPKTTGPTPEMTRMGAGYGDGEHGDNNGRFVDTTSTTDVDGEFGSDDGSGLEGHGMNLSGNRNPDAYASVYFDFDRSYIRESERAALNDVAKRLLGNPSEKILIEGHCDWKGTTEYNLALGDRRANAVKSYLVQMGVSPSSIEITTKGDLESIDGADDAGRQLDRRGDIIILK